LGWIKSRVHESSHLEEGKSLNFLRLLARIKRRKPSPGFTVVYLSTFEYSETFSNV